MKIKTLHNNSHVRAFLELALSSPNKLEESLTLNPFEMPLLHITGQLMGLFGTQEVIIILAIIIITGVIIAAVLNGSRSSASHATPNSTNFTSAVEKTGYSIGKQLGIGGVVVAAVIITYLLANKGNDRYIPQIPKSPEQLRIELGQQEASSPEQYISHEGTWKKNFIGETVLEGTLKSSATIANFKDVKLLVTYLSKTNSPTGRENFVVYEFLKAGQIVRYKIKTYAPDATSQVNVNVTGASTSN